MKFGFSLNQIGAHTFCEFIHKIFMHDDKQVWKYFDLNDIDWHQLVRNMEHQIEDNQYDKINGQIPLLQILIDNENSEKESWQLEGLFDEVFRHLNKLRLNLKIMDSSN